MVLNETVRLAPDWYDPKPLDEAGQGLAQICRVKSVRQRFGILLGMSEESAFENRPKVFVVDDEPAIAKMLAVVLQMNLLDAIPYFDPQEALEAAKMSPPEYVISDIGMPGMSGIELGIAIRAAVPSCKILLFSGQVDALEQLGRAAAAGHEFELLQKPVQPKVLVDTLLAMRSVAV